MILCITRLSNTVAEHIVFELGLLEAIDPTLQTVVSFVDGMRISNVYFFVPNVYFFGLNIYFLMPANNLR